MEDRMFLYKAVKYQVKEYQADGGWKNMAQLWSVVNNRGYWATKLDWKWWRDEVLEDYERYLDKVKAIEEDTYTVALMTAYGPGFGEECHPLAIGVDKATADSVYRHFDKECHFSDSSQAGTYLVCVSQKYCTNHEDFEEEITWDDLMDEIYDPFEPTAEDLKEWQMASCGLV